MNLLIKLLFISLLLGSCAKKTLDGVERIKLPKVKTSELVHTLDSLAQYKPESFYSKISCKFNDTNQNISFKTSLKMIRDSAMTALISFATIPIFNVLLTKDSLHMQNKREKCFSKERLSALKESFGIAFDYVNVEELFLGVPFAFDSTQKYVHLRDPFNYIISSHKRRMIRRNDRRNQEEIVFKYFLSDDAKGLKKMVIDNPEDTTNVQVDYNTFQMVEGHNYPDEVVITIKSPRNTMNITLNYNKIDVVERQIIEFVIPEEYNKCVKVE
jgi:hypothetical protein